MTTRHSESWFVFVRRYRWPRARNLRRRAFGTVARRACQRRRAGSPANCRHPPADLDADPRRQDGPRPGTDQARKRTRSTTCCYTSTAGCGTESGRPDPRRAAHPRALTGARTRPGCWPSCPASCSAARAIPSLQRALSLAEDGTTTNATVGGPRRPRLVAAQRPGWPSAAGPTHWQHPTPAAVRVRATSDTVSWHRSKIERVLSVAGSSRPGRRGRRSRWLTCYHRAQLLLRGPERCRGCMEARLWH